MGGVQVSDWFTKIVIGMRSESTPDLSSLVRIRSRQQVEFENDIIKWRTSVMVLSGAC